jgi:hypothetical protein
MFLMWLIGICLMAAAGWIFYYYHKTHGVAYEKFIFENSNEFGILAPKDWGEYKEFQKIEAKARIQGVLVGKPVVWLFTSGMVLFIIPTVKFIFRM